MHVDIIIHTKLYTHTLALRYVVNDNKSWWPASDETFLKQKYNALLQSLLDDPGPLTNGELGEKIKKDDIN